LFELPLVNTIILLASGFTVTYGHHFLINGKRGKTLYGLLYTIILAVIFTGLTNIFIFFFMVGFIRFFLNYYYLTVVPKKILPKIYSIRTFPASQPLALLTKHGVVRKHKLPLHMKRFYTTGLVEPKVSPHWVTGFCDASTHNLSLVVFGTNLQSTVGKKYTNKQLAMVRLTPFTRSVIIGLILSDGWLIRASRPNARLGFKQSLSHASYVWFVFNLLSHYCFSYPSLVIGIRAGNRNYALQFFTRSMPCLTELHSLFYPAGKKVIPSNIYDLLTPVALAHLIQGDGQTARHGLVLCTNSIFFLKKKKMDVVRLMNVLIIRYRLECNIREYRRSNGKLEFMIYIRQGSMPLLRTIVKPNMHPSMLYKIDNCKAYCPTKRFATKELSLPDPHKRLYSTINLQRREVDPYWVTGFSDAEATFSLKVSKSSTTRSGLHLLSKSWQRQKVFYSTVNIQPVIDPYWISGFCDGESCFSLRVAKKSGSKSGWGFTPDFRIHLHIKDIIMLRRIQCFFGIGTIYQSNNTISYVVQSLREINNVIIPHFDKYSLITQKKADYLLLKKSIDLLNSKAHLELEGIRKVLSFKASMNNGLSETLKSYFPDIIPATRPLISFQKIDNPNWLAGFVDGEGCFSVETSTTRANQAFYTIIRFSVSQHVRDEALLTQFINYLGCGKIVKMSKRPDSVIFVVSKFRDVKEKIIPFFNKYSLVGVKAMDFRDFCEVANIIENKSHLTAEGFKKIKSLKSGMNSNRILS